MSDANIPQTLSHTCSNGETFAIAVRVSSRLRAPQIKLDKGQFIFVVPAWLRRSDLERTLPQIRLFVENNADEAKAQFVRLAKEKSSHAQEQTFPSSYTYTTHSGIVCMVAIRRSTRARKVTITLKNGRFELVVPTWASRETFSSLLPLTHNFLEKWAAKPTNLLPREQRKPEGEIPNSLTYTCKDGRQITVGVQISARARYVRIKLISGRFIIVVPKGIRKKVLDEALPNLYSWLERELPTAEQPQKHESLPPEIAIPLLHKNLPIKVDNTYLNATQRLSELTPSSLCITMKMDTESICAILYNDVLEIYGGGQDLFFQVMALQYWCQRAAEYYLPPILREVLQQNSLPDVVISIRDQSSRWGSCRKKAGVMPSISLNWRAILLPEKLIRHLCVHESGHLLHMNHSPAFKQAMQKMEAEARELEKELDKAWQKLPWWAVHKRYLKNTM